MGVGLTPNIIKQTIALEDLRGKLLAVDANGELYQFLALIRLRDGSPLRDSRGRVTSHPPGLKSAEIGRRREIRHQRRWTEKGIETDFRMRIH